MGDPINIQNMLETGYYNTSRARSTGPCAPHKSPLPSERVPSRTSSLPVTVQGDIPRTVYLAPAPSPRKPHPPSPTVEDEVESRAKEHDPFTQSSSSGDEPPSKGEVDQCPIIMEVHEHNPERRFVIVPESANDQEAATNANDVPSPARRAHDDAHRDYVASKKPLRPEDAYDGKDAADISRYGLDRRQSQQVLSPLVTDLKNYRPHPVSRSSSAGTYAGPDYFSPRQSRGQRGHLLSPDIGPRLRTGREKASCDAEKPLGSSSPRSLSRSSQKSQRSDGGATRDRRDRDSAPFSARPYYDGSGRVRVRRRMTNDSDASFREEIMYLNDETKLGHRERERQAEMTRKISPRSSGHFGRSAEDFGRSMRSLEASTEKTRVLREPKSSSRPSETNSGRIEESRSPSSSSQNRASPIVPLARAAAAQQTVSEASRTASRHSAKSMPQIDDEPFKAQAPQLPYPDDDQAFELGLGIQHANSEGRHAKLLGQTSVCMPEPLLIPKGIPDCPPSPFNGTPGTPAASTTPQPWTPGTFDPYKDAFPAERPIGAYRRYSENQANGGVTTLPQCPRQHPIAGRMDWLTLPHTSFNICPSCYEGVFAKSQYRTLFKPMLWPSDEPKSCDFGVSPWYRIAWLLTCRDDVPDLRLLKQVANVTSAPSREACPGPKQAARNWMTVRDSCTGLPVADFAVCYQCAATVELLLPNLRGVFELLDSRPCHRICDLHFTPERKEFTLFFDALETTSEQANMARKPPNMDDLAQKLWCLTVGTKCREDTPVIDGYWHTMQFLRDFTVCGKCFEEVVKPELIDGSSIARNFFMKPQRLRSATCQLYSARMRDIFRRSCREENHKYLEEKVAQRRRKEKNIYEQLVELEKSSVSSSWKQEKVDKLIDEWKRWE